MPNLCLLAGINSTDRPNDDSLVPSVSKDHTLPLPPSLTTVTQGPLV